MHGHSAGDNMPSVFWVEVLPRPEDTVDHAMMQEEHGITRRSMQVLFWSELYLNTKEKPGGGIHTEPGSPPSTACPPP